MFFKQSGEQCQEKIIMLLSKRAKNLLEKKEGKEREKERERKIYRKIYRPIISLSIDIVVKNLLNFYLQSMGFAEAGLERLWIGGLKAEEFRNLNTEESQNLASMTIWGLINKIYWTFLLMHSNWKLKV